MNILVYLLKRFKKSLRRNIHTKSSAHISVHFFEAPEIVDRQLRMHVDNSGGFNYKVQPRDNEKKKTSQIKGWFHTYVKPVRNQQQMRNRTKTKEFSEWMGWMGGQRHVQFSKILCSFCGFRVFVFSEFLVCVYLTSPNGL